MVCPKLSGDTDLRRRQRWHDSCGFSRRRLKLGLARESELGPMNPSGRGGVCRARGNSRSASIAIGKAAPASLGGDDMAAFRSAGVPGRKGAAGARKTVRGLIRSIIGESPLMPEGKAEDGVTSGGLSM